MRKRGSLNTECREKTKRARRKLPDVARAKCPVTRLLVQLARGRRLVLAARHPKFLAASEGKAEHDESKEPRDSGYTNDEGRYANSSRD